MPTQNDPRSAETTFACDCGYQARLSCTGENFYGEHEGKKYCVLHFPALQKLEAFRSALKRKLDAQDFNFEKVWFPESVDFKGTVFSTEANFSDTTFSAKANFSEAKFTKANFYNATFTEADFSGAIFTEANFYCATFSAKANFLGATFKNYVTFSNTTFTEATFGKAIFGKATLTKVEFYYATFSAKANFLGATFTEANFFGTTFTEANFSKSIFSGKVFFNKATFTEVNFSEAIFTEADFSEATFTEADFSEVKFNALANFHKATFKDYVTFAGSSQRKVFGEHPRLNFQFARIEKPERVSFHTLYLYPSWFLNTDSRKFGFTAVEWDFNLKEALQQSKEALQRTPETEVSKPHNLLAIAHRQLADNAEANHRYLEASRFRFNAFEAHRLEDFKGRVPWRLDWWYWAASGYGERVGRAFKVFVLLLALFAFGYMKVGFDQSGKSTSGAAQVTASATMLPDNVGKPLGCGEALVYSFNVIILQKPEPKPVTLTAKALVGLETLLGPLQAALLALAVRRRFMR